MANKKISELNEATSVNDSDVLPIVQSGETKKASIEKIKTNILSSTKEVLYTGNLRGGQSITLDTTKIKKILKIYAICAASESINYEIYVDGNPSNEPYGSGIAIAYDEPSGSDFYVSEASYNKTTGVLSHRRTGYFKTTTGAYTSRNNIDSYSILKIETYD